jgi:hypothetical protein
MRLAGGEEVLEIEVFLVEVELEGLEADVGVAEEEQGVDEVDEPLSVVAALNAGDAQGGGGFPEVAPAPREQARPHHFVRGEEGEHVVEEVVGEGADAVAMDALLPVAPLQRHYVEQATCSVWQVSLAGCSGSRLHLQACRLGPSYGPNA